MTPAVVPAAPPSINRLHPAAWPSELGRVPGASLLFLTSAGCGTCATVRSVLATGLDVPFTVHVFELDAAEGSRAVHALRVFHLPALFLYRYGAFHAPVDAPATREAMSHALLDAWEAPPVEEP